MWHNQKQTRDIENKVEGFLKNTLKRDEEMENVEETDIKTSVTKVITKYIHSKNRDRRKLHQACTLRIKVNKI